MDQELQVRIAPITSRLHMLVPKSVQTHGETRQPAERSAKTSRRRPGQLVRTTA